MRWNLSVWWSKARNASPFIAVCLVVPTIAAAQPQEAIGKDAAFEEGVELVFDELRQVGSGGRLRLGDEGRGVLLRQAVQRGLLRTMTFVVDRGALRRPLELPADDCTRGSRGCDPGRSQAAHRVAIALRGTHR